MSIASWLITTLGVGRIVHRAAVPHASMLRCPLIWPGVLPCDKLEIARRRAISRSRSRILEDVWQRVLLSWRPWADARRQRLGGGQFHDTFPRGYAQPGGRCTPERSRLQPHHNCHAILNTQYPTTAHNPDLQHHYYHTSCLRPVTLPRIRICDQPTYYSIMISMRNLTLTIR